MKTGLVPGELIISTGDTHIYKNHIDKVAIQIQREPSDSFPRLILNKSIETKDFKDISIDDFELVDYNPHEAIKATMAI